MNVAVIIDYYPPRHDGGDSIFARDLAVGLKELVTPIVFTRIPRVTSTRVFDDAGVKVVYLGDDWQRKLLGYIHDIDLVHFFQIDNLPMVRFIKERREVPVLFHMEISFKRYSELFEPDYDSEKYNLLEKEAVELSDKLIVPCKNELEQIARLYPSAGVVTIPNGINYSLRLGNPFGAPKKNYKTNFAFMGRLDDPMKGGYDLIEAMNQLPHEYLNRAHFIFIGCRDSRFLKQIEALRKTAACEVHPWISDENELWQKLAETHFMLMPSRYETFGMVCLESMAMGIVPIASDAGALGEIVIDKVNGFYVDISRNASHHLARAIMRSIEMNDLEYQRMKEASIMKARKDYKIENIANEVVGLYKILGVN
ncbi:MAG: glycosyltransferase family 4 protein [archaeon]